MHCAAAADTSPSPPIKPEVSGPAAASWSTSAATDQSEARIPAAWPRSFAMEPAAEPVADPTDVSDALALDTLTLTTQNVSDGTAVAGGSWTGAGITSAPQSSAPSLATNPTSTAVYAITGEPAGCVLDKPARQVSVNFQRLQLQLAMNCAVCLRRLLDMHAGLCN